MKKVAEFIEGTFIDYKGDEREYTICALSCPIEEGDDNASDTEVKQLRLGIAVRRDGDEYVRGIGITEARQKKTHSLSFALTLVVLSILLWYRLFLNRKQSSLKRIRVSILQLIKLMQKDISSNLNLKKNVKV